MLPPFCCSPSTDMDGMKRQHQQRKHAMLSMWRDGVERQLSALNAAIDTLEKQMNRTSNQTDWSEFKRSLRVANARFRRRWTVMAETPMALPANLRLFPSKITKRIMFWSLFYSFCRAPLISATCSLRSIFCNPSHLPVINSSSSSTHVVLYL